MPEIAASIATQQSTRNRHLVVPREHGAWGIMLIPLATGACIAIPQAKSLSGLLLFIVAAVSLFWLRTPIESYFGWGIMRARGVEERRYVARAIFMILPVSLLCMIALLWDDRNSGLLIIGCLVGLAFAVQAGMRLVGRRARFASQLVGSVGLTATSAAAYYVMTGRFDSNAFAIWLASWVFAANQIHYVQTRIGTSRLGTERLRFSAAKYFLLGQVLMLVVVALVSSTGLLPPLTVIAFLPVFVRGLLWLRESKAPFNLKRIGVSELSHGFLFGALLTVVFLIHI